LTEILKKHVVCICNNYYDRRAAAAILGKHRTLFGTGGT